MSKASSSGSQPRRLKKFRLKLTAGYEPIHSRACARAYTYLWTDVRKERDYRKWYTPTFSGSTPVSSKDVRKVILAFLESLDHPRGLTVALLFRSPKDHHQLLNLACDPDMYGDERSFGAAFAATKLLSKCVDLNVDIDREAVAVASAMSAEVKNRETNDFFRLKRLGLVTGLRDRELDRARETIAKVLGDCPSEISMFDDDVSQGTIDRHYEHLVDLGLPKDVAWSNGRTTSASGDHLSQVRKYLSTCDVTSSARPYAVKMVSNSQLWTDLVGPATGPRWGSARGAVLMTVPKNAKTDRVICYEPTMNIRLQLALGTYIKGRLRKVGVNLYDQSINQRRARLGSLWGRLATIDLKSASDTLCRELVWELLPPDWAALLDDLRSHETLWPWGKWMLNEKFSSMGNGFTFELESLIFYAICSSVSHSVSVFGDDIVLPVEHAREAISLLSYCGFDTNVSKSFLSGPFRESCGMNAYLGNDVTPVYLKELPRVLRDLVGLHNKVWAFATRKRIEVTRIEEDRIIQGPMSYIDPKVGAICRAIREDFPFYTGPSGLGDGHYHTPFSEAWVWDASSEYESRGWEGWWFQTEIAEYRDSWLGDDRHFRGEEGIAALLTATGPKRPRAIEDTTANRRVTGYRSIRSLASRWPAYFNG